MGASITATSRKTSQGVGWKFKLVLTRPNTPIPSKLSQGQEMQVPVKKPHLEVNSNAEYTTTFLEQLTES